MSQIFGQSLIIFQKLRYRCQVLLKVRAVEVGTSFYWISLRSIQLFSKLGNIICWKPLWKETSSKGLKLFDSPTKNWRPFKIFAKLSRLVYEKFGLRLTGLRNCHFSIFVFFIFPNFKLLLSKILSKNHLHL